jgi:hypothetical protein
MPGSADPGVAGVDLELVPFVSLRDERAGIVR